MAGFVRKLVFCVLAAGQAGFALAQSSGGSARPDAAAIVREQREAIRRKFPSDFGPACCTVLQIPASAFQLWGGQPDWGWNNNGYVYGGVGTSTAWAPVELPTGTLIVFLDLYYDDQEPSTDVEADLFLYPGWGGDPQQLIQSVFSSGSSGKGYAASTPFSHTVNNDSGAGGGQYSVVVTTSIPFLGGPQGFKGVDIWFYRQVSPAPATATFNDVPTSHPFFRFVEAIAAAGITVGCGGGNFCPDQPITRKQEAAFISKALGLYWPY